MKNKNMSFSFSFVTKDIILNELRKLNLQKLYKKMIFQSKRLKKLYILFPTLFIILFSLKVPSYLKNATVTPIFKKKDRANIDNYRPVCILPNLSKVYERCM